MHLPGYPEGDRLVDAARVPSYMIAADIGEQAYGLGHGGARSHRRAG
jgi:hypothetical protein